MSIFSSMSRTPDSIWGRHSSSCSTGVSSPRLSRSSPPPASVLMDGCIVRMAACSLLVCCCNIFSTSTAPCSCKHVQQARFTGRQGWGHRNLYIQHTQHQLHLLLCPASDLQAGATLHCWQNWHTFWLRASVELMISSSGTGRCTPTRTNTSPASAAFTHSMARSDRSSPNCFLHSANTLIAEATGRPINSVGSKPNRLLLALALVDSTTPCRLTCSSRRC